MAFNFNKFKKGDKVVVKRPNHELRNNILFVGMSIDTVFDVESTNGEWVRLVGVSDGYHWTCFKLVKIEHFKEDLFQL